MFCFFLMGWVLFHCGFDLYFPVVLIWWSVMLSILPLSIMHTIFPLTMLHNRTLLPTQLLPSFCSLMWVSEWVKVTQSCLTLRPHGLVVHGILQARILEWVSFPFSRGSSQPRDQTQVSHNAGGFFTSWATRKAKNSGVGSLFLLQRIFLTK